MNIASIWPWMAASKPQSAKTTLALLPPSSRTHFLIESAARRLTSRPTSTLPVSVTMSTSGEEASAAPTSPPGPVSTWTTPGGAPASWKTSASRSAVSGVTDAGLRMTTLPAASAGASLVTAMAMG